MIDGIQVDFQNLAAHVTQTMLRHRDFSSEILVSSTNCFGSLLKRKPTNSVANIYIFANNPRSNSGFQCDEAFKVSASMRSMRWVFNAIRSSSR
jgi:hypothetical protein